MIYKKNLGIYIDFVKDIPVVVKEVEKNKEFVADLLSVKKNEAKEIREKFKKMVEEINNSTDDTQNNEKNYYLLDIGSIFCLPYICLAEVYDSNDFYLIGYKDNNVIFAISLPVVESVEDPDEAEFEMYNHYYRIVKEPAGDLEVIINRKRIGKILEQMYKKYERDFLYVYYPPYYLEGLIAYSFASVMDKNVKLEELEDVVEK